MSDSQTDGMYDSLGKANDDYEDDICPTCGHHVTLDLETVDEDTMVKIGGKCFYCHCGCNVFRKLKSDNSRYVCNSCGELYQGE